MLTLTVVAFIEYISFSTMQLTSPTEFSSSNTALRSVQSNEKKFDVSQQYTIVLNTFQRDALVEELLRHYQTCPRIRWVYVSWNDIQRPIPASLRRHHPVVVASDFDNNRIYNGNKDPIHADAYVEKATIAVDSLSRPSYLSGNRVVFYVDASNVISNRFRVRYFETEAVFSTDDDMQYDCTTLDAAHDLWLKARDSSDEELGIVPMENPLQSQEAESSVKVDMQVPNAREATRKLIGVGFHPRLLDFSQYLSMPEYRNRPDLFNPQDDPALGRYRIRYYQAETSFRQGYYNTLFVTKGAFLPREAYSYYFHKDYDESRALVDEHTTGEDILMSAMCWHKNIKMLALHSRPSFMEFVNFASLAFGSQNTVSLGKRSSKWRPLIISKIVEMMGEIYNIPDEIESAMAAEVARRSQPVTDLWYVRWFWGLDYSAIHLGGSSAMSQNLRIYLFTKSFAGLFIKTFRW